MPTSTPQPNPPDIDYALNNWATDLTPNSDKGCTEFLVHILQAGGVNDLVGQKGTRVAEKYFSDRFESVKFEGPKFAGSFLRGNEVWEGKINDPRIRPGDVVFYTMGTTTDHQAQDQPDHTAFIVSVGLPETTFFTSFTTRRPKPRIVEQDGLLNLDPTSPCLTGSNPVACGNTNQAGRSIDDTKTWMYQVTIYLRSFPKR